MPPFPINPNNYNIDYFQSAYLSNITTDTDYLDFLFSRSLPTIAPELIGSPAGDFQSVYDNDKGAEKSINDTAIADPGNVEEWLAEAGYPASRHELLLSYFAAGSLHNDYGPPVVESYNCPLEVPEETGWIQYPTHVGSGLSSEINDFVNSIAGTNVDVSSTLAETVGLGIAPAFGPFAIDFDSDLAKIAEERRIVELKNRVAENIVSQTIGKINLDPLGLLAGQPLFNKDYKITKAAFGLLGFAIDTASDIAGVNALALTTNKLFGGPLPKGAFDWQDKDPLVDPFSPTTVDISKTIKNRTGSGTWSLLMDNLEVNRYGPIIEKSANDPSSIIGNPARKKRVTDRRNERDRKPQAGYIGFPNFIGDQSKKSQRKENRLNNKIIKKTAKGKGRAVARIDRRLEKLLSGKKGLTPYESLNPTVSQSPLKVFQLQGFEWGGSSELESEVTFELLREGWNKSHTSGWRPQYSKPRQITPQLDYISSGDDEGGSDGTYMSNESGTRVKGFNTGVDSGMIQTELWWREDRVDNQPRRGLLRYTQELINKSTNKAGTSAQFIGMTNSDINYNAETGDRRHVQVSQGALVKETIEGGTPAGDFQEQEEYYCRSWSIRNAYNKYYNLIRYDELWRENQPGTIEKGKSSPGRKLNSFSTLRQPGLPKIAWERDDLTEIEIEAAAKLKQLVPDAKNVIPYMFSIENLAWKDSPHYRKLPPCEQGPFGGRIMWFPPYNINFTDNTSINWDTTSFIGRAEPIYTYNNTERTGTLAFSVIIDHPSVLNKLKDDLVTPDVTAGNKSKKAAKQQKSNIETFFAGCDAGTTKKIIRDAFKEILIPDIDVEVIEEREIKKKDVEAIGEGLSFHFKNACTGKGLDGNKDGCYENNPTIQTASLCPEGYVGRCIDEAYQISSLVVVDNPQLYVGVTNCDQGLINTFGQHISKNDQDCFNTYSFFGMDDEYTEDSMLLAPSNLPCGGPSASFESYGPNPGFNSSGVFTDLRDNVSVNAKCKKDEYKGWNRCGEGYKSSNFCKQNIPTTGTTSGVTYPSNQLGWEFTEIGVNERFWGSGSINPKVRGVIDYETDGSPKIKLPVEPPALYSVGGPGEGYEDAGISRLINFLVGTPEGKHYTVKITGQCSAAATGKYNKKLGKDRAENFKKWMIEKMAEAEQKHGTMLFEDSGNGSNGTIEYYSEAECTNRYTTEGLSSDAAQQTVGDIGNDTLSAPNTDYTNTPFHWHVGDFENVSQLMYRRVDITLEANNPCVDSMYEEAQKQESDRVIEENKKNKAKAEAEKEKEKQEALALARNFINECDYFLKVKETDSFLYDSINDKIQNFHPAFHSITPEGFNSRLTFLEQCGRQGPSFIDPEQPQNTAFGRPPVCILRLGDFYFTKIIIDTINLTFDPLQWDLNPEGVGVQPMVCSVDLNFRFIGGSTLQGPLTQLQNAVSYNFFANTALYMPIEEFLAKRADGGGFLLEGEEGFEDAEGDSRKYFYGPWASQADFENRTGIDKEDEKELVVEDEGTDNLDDVFDEEAGVPEDQQPTGCIPPNFLELEIGYNVDPNYHNQINSDGGTYRFNGKDYASNPNGSTSDKPYFTEGGFRMTRQEYSELTVGPQNINRKFYYEIYITDLDGNIQANVTENVPIKIENGCVVNSAEVMEALGIKTADNTSDVDGNVDADTEFEEENKANTTTVDGDDIFKEASEAHSISINGIHMWTVNVEGGMIVDAHYIKQNPAISYPIQESALFDSNKKNFANMKTQGGTTDIDFPVNGIVVSLKEEHLPYSLPVGKGFKITLVEVKKYKSVGSSTNPYTSIHIFDDLADFAQGVYYPDRDAPEQFLMNPFYDILIDVNSFSELYEGMNADWQISPMVEMLGDMGCSHNKQATNVAAAAIEWSDCTEKDVTYFVEYYVQADPTTYDGTELKNDIGGERKVVGKLVKINVKITKEGLKQLLDDVVTSFG